MAVQHKFLNVPRGGFGGDQRFWTANGILHTDAYEPEVLFVGTFNPDTPNANFADFYYGRNYFWPAMADLLKYNAPVLLQRRMPTNGAPQGVLVPSLQDIVKMCVKGRIAFADLIGEVLHKGVPQYHPLANDNVVWNGVEYNLIQDGMQNGVAGLVQLHAFGQVNWKTQAITAYLQATPSIKLVYFTRRPAQVWREQWNLLVNNANLVGRSFTNLFTPSGQGAPVHRNMIRLLHHWVYNQNPNFGHLDHHWLQQHGVNPANF